MKMNLKTIHINIKNRLEYSLYKIIFYIMNWIDNNSIDSIDKIDSIDDNWIDEYKTTSITRLSIHHLYININGILDMLKKDKYRMKNNTITKREIEYLIKENINYNNKNYKLYFLSKFNINKSILEQEDLPIENDTNTYFTTYNQLEDITFETNGFYNETNTLYLIYHEKPEINTYIPTLKIPYYTEKHLRKTNTKKSSHQKNKTKSKKMN